MGNYRFIAHLAFALTLLSLTCDLGAVCALAGVGESCCCPMAEAGSHCDVSGGNEAPNSAAPDATLEASERFSVAILDRTLPATSSAALSSPGSERLIAAPHSASTPLYISHCVFLC